MLIPMANGVSVLLGKKKKKSGKREGRKSGSDEMTLASVLCAGRRVHPSDGVQALFLGMVV